MKILFLSRWFPYPMNNGSKLRVHALLRGLAAHHDVTLISFADELNRQPDALTIRDLCREVHVIDWPDFEPHSWRARAAFFGGAPRSVVATHSPAMATAIRRCLIEREYDLMIASQLATAAYVRHFRGVPALFEEVESTLFWEQYAHAASRVEQLRYGLTWHKYRRYLTGILQCFQSCTVASEGERELIQNMTRDSVQAQVIPNCVDLTDYAGIDHTVAPDSLIFTGPFRYAANYEAMTWFLTHVFPLIQAQRPAAALTITGDHAELPLPPAKNVTLTGQVPDVRPLIARSACSIAPLQSGGGTRLKILEAMAIGTPVVTTSKGVEGIAAVDGEHLLIADSPADFADAVTRILAEPSLRRRLTENALHLVRSRYDWAGIMPQFLSLVEQSAGRKPASHLILAPWSDSRACVIKPSCCYDPSSWIGNALARSCRGCWQPAHCCSPWPRPWSSPATNSCCSPEPAWA